MIQFQPTKTRRLDLTLKELSVKQARAVCQISASRHEKTITQFLSYVTGFSDGSGVLDPAMMTVQERALLVCQYLSSTLDDGPNFAVGSMRLDAFINFNVDWQADEVQVGEISGESVYMGHLLGVHAMDLEGLCRDRGDWRIGMMACQIRLASMPRIDVSAMTEVERINWLDDRIEAISGMPESQVSELYDTIFVPGQEMLKHFFDVAVDNDGVCFAANEEAGFGLGRFQPRAGITARTQAIFC